MFNRKYTVTIKPVSKVTKGNFDLLKDIYEEFLTIVGGSNNYLTFEMKGTESVHLHAIISCPLIKDKRAITKQLKGYHLNTQIILYRDYDDIEDIWLKYTNKEVSDADRYTLLYGCMIPIIDESNIVHFDI